MQAKSAKESSNIQKNQIQTINDDLDLARDFLCLVKIVDILPEIKRHGEQQTRSLYQAVSAGRDLNALESQLEAFFGEPQKPAGKSASRALRSHPAIKYLGGIRKEQAIFIKKARTGVYYGVLEPDAKSKQTKIHLGFCNHEMSEEDHRKFETLVKRSLRNEKLFDKLDARHGGRIQDIQFATFLRLAELLKLTCTVKIQKDKSVGYLFLYKGDLIAAETGSLKNREAAYEIVGWKNTKIEIEKASAQTENNIKQPLIDILKEGLRIRKRKISAKKIPKIEAEKSKSSAKKGPHSEVMPTDTFDQPPPEKPLGKVKGPAKPRKKQALPLAAIVIGGVLIFTIVAGVSLYFFTSTSLEDQYQRLLVNVENQTELEQKQLLLQNFINSHDQSEYTLNAEKKIEEINQRIEERDYNLSLQQVGMLPLDENYQAEATTIYSRYLEKFPDSPHADEIAQKISEIPNRIEAADYEKLKEIAHLDYDRRIAAYTKYLADHPRGQYIVQVEHLISGMSEEYFNHLKQEMPVCEKLKEWDNCIHLSSQYLKYFQNSMRSYEVAELKKQFEDKRDLILLQARAENEGDNFEGVKQIFLKYLETNPDSSEKEKLEKELVKLEGKIEDKKQWETIAAYSKDEQIEVSNRIYKLKRYIRKNPSGSYIEDAKVILEDLQSEKQAIRQRQIIAQQKMQQARLQQEKERKKKEEQRIQMEMDRIQGEREEMRARLLQSGARFVANGDGTVTDSQTGLMWSILDSQQELGNCLNYDSAVAYIENLTTGDYHDWRLPNAGDLAGIYKNNNPFPDSGAAWYWTSETTVAGYHTLGGIVTTKKENVFNREYKNLEECGAVRAVRP